MMPASLFSASLKRRSVLLCVLVPMCTMVLVAVGVFYVRWNQPTVFFPNDFFPTGISESLSADLQVSKQRIERNPTASTWGAMGELCMAHEMIPQATFCFRQAEQLAPDEPKWVYLQAVMAEEVDIALAISLCKRVVAANADAAALHLRLGKLQMRAGELAGAAESLRRAAELSGDHPLVMSASAQLLAIERKTNAASEVYRRMCRDARTGEDLMLIAEQWFARHGSVEVESDAFADRTNRHSVTESVPDVWLRGVAARMPTTQTLAAEAGAMATAKNYSAAIRIYNELIHAESRNSRSHAFRAMVLMNAGKTDVALKEISAVCQQFPDDALAWSCRGAIEFQQGDQQAAISSLKTATMLKPDFVDAHRALLMIFLMREMREEALQQFQMLKVLTPGDSVLDREYQEYAAATATEKASEE